MRSGPLQPAFQKSGGDTLATLLLCSECGDDACGALVADDRPSILDHRTDRKKSNRVIGIFGDPYRQVDICQPGRVVLACGPRVVAQIDRRPGNVPDEGLVQANDCFEIL